MKYLLYYIDGFIKKFPLEDETISIGRTPDNDLDIDDETISRKHLKIKVEEDVINIEDLRSTNGTYVHSGKVHEAVINIGESFCLGRMEFFLKRGTIGDFTLAKELVPIFKRIGNDNENNFLRTKTRYITDIYNEILKQVLKAGIKKNNFNDFLPVLSNYLSSLSYIGDLFIVSKLKDELNVLFSIKKKNGIKENLEKIISENPDMFVENIDSRPISKLGGIFCSYPLEINNNRAVLIYISNDSRNKTEPKIKKFLLSLSKELDLLAQLFSEGSAERGEIECGPEREEESVGNLEDEPDLDVLNEIIVGNDNMKEIIKQAKKISRSNVFVLIQGESGTGKELFARLIFKHSRRSGKKFVPINCAAIPENLLESELFGHEKGAFTGAYARKIGKLEIASGGTLVFDEIGDMPLNLQSKLLRALQEQEFYRLGGSIPIKVDLRIISITNQNLKALIKQKQFRQDLYYRLVHHTIDIPPLRERKEDISVLINYFTNKFCRQNNKTVNGYSLKAFRVLQDYNWPGNVRQMENEINRIVNLTEHGEIINYDILSDDITHPEMESGDTVIFPSYQLNSEAEKDFLLSLLEKYNWNKSKVARSLKMTYQGLHKKTKRLGLEKPKTNT
jgi:transcriptional regulator with PAS, ATPase and Fis domain